MTDKIFIPEYLQPLADQIDAFLASDDPTLLLDHELTKKERHCIHSYIETHDLHSVSIPLKGTNNKKIRVLRVGERKDLTIMSNRSIDNEDIDCFASNIGAPFPCTDPDLLEYFVNTFDCMFDAKRLWDLFLSERNDDGMAIRREMSQVRQKICDMIRQNANYQAYQKLRFRGQGNRIRGDVYHLGSVGKTFVSLDIKSANFTCIRLICPELFTDAETGDPVSWHDFVRTLTNSEFVAQSKIFREIAFGKLGFAKGANVLQEAIMERVDQVLQTDPLMGKLFNSDTIRMKCGDENVYELPDVLIPDDDLDGCSYKSRDLLLKTISVGILQRFMGGIKVSEIPTLARVFDALGHDIDVELGDIFHIRIFTVDKIGAKKYFVKTFRYRSDWDCNIVDHESHDEDERSPIEVIHQNAELPLRKLIEFKRVDKRFYLQVLKYYQGLPIEENDLYFTDSGVKAKYCYTIFE
jgi:hypothetical protein